MHYRTYDGIILRNLARVDESMLSLFDRTYALREGSDAFDDLEDDDDTPAPAPPAASSGAADTKRRRGRPAREKTEEPAKRRPAGRPANEELSPTVTELSRQLEKVGIHIKPQALSRQINGYIEKNEDEIRRALERESLDDNVLNRQHVAAPLFLQNRIRRLRDLTDNADGMSSILAHTGDIVKIKLPEELIDKIADDLTDQGYAFSNDEVREIAERMLAGGGAAKTSAEIFVKKAVEKWMKDSHAHRLQLADLYSNVTDAFMKMRQSVDSSAAIVSAVFQLIRDRYTKVYKPRAAQNRTFARNAALERMGNGELNYDDFTELLTGFLEAYYDQIPLVIAGTMYDYAMKIAEWEENDFDDTHAPPNAAAISKHLAELLDRFAFREATDLYRDLRDRFNDFIEDLMEGGAERDTGTGYDTSQDEEDTKRRELQARLMDAEEDMEYALKMGREPSRALVVQLRGLRAALGQRQMRVPNRLRSQAGHLASDMHNDMVDLIRNYARKHFTVRNIMSALNDEDIEHLAQAYGISMTRAKEMISKRTGEIKSSNMNLASVLDISFKNEFDRGYVKALADIAKTEFNIDISTLRTRQELADVLKRAEDVMTKRARSTGLSGIIMKNAPKPKKGKAVDEDEDDEKQKPVPDEELKRAARMPGATPVKTSNKADEDDAFARAQLRAKIAERQRMEREQGLNKRTPEQIAAELREKAKKARQGGGSANESFVPLVGSFNDWLTGRTSVK